jgi:hypothetical protein
MFCINEPYKCNCFPCTCLIVKKAADVTTAKNVGLMKSRQFGNTQIIVMIYKKCM